MKITAYNEAFQSNYNSHDWIPNNSYIAECTKCLYRCFNIDSIGRKTAVTGLISSDRYIFLKYPNINLDLLTCHQVVLIDIMK